MRLKFACLGALASLCLLATASAHPAASPMLPQAAARSADLAIAGGNLRFPLDPGYRSVRDEAPAMLEILSAGLPLTLRLVDAFYSEQDLKRSALGQGSPERPFFAVQVLRDSESMLVSEEEWTQAKPALVRAMGDLDMDALLRKNAIDSSARLSDAAGTKVTLDLANVGKPRIYWVEGDSVRFMMLLPFKGKVGSAVIDATLVAAGAIVRVRGKLIYVYLYDSYRDEQSVPQLQARFDQFLPRLFAVNDAQAAPLGAPSSSASGDPDAAASMTLGAPTEAGKPPE